MSAETHLNRREEIFEMVERERAYQDIRWGKGFDDQNTPNDWIAYITLYAGKAVTMPWDQETFRTMVLKVMTICCAILERDEYAPRHYDKA